MKRSEMLELIKTTLTEIQFLEKNKAADILLSRIEEKEMLPPLIKNPALSKELTAWEHADNKAMYYLYNPFGDYPEFAVNAWENE